MRFWTFSAVSSAVIVHVAPFFDLAHQRATAMARANEAGEGEVVFALSILLLVAAIQDFLAALPDRSADQRLVTSSIDLAAVLELAPCISVFAEFCEAWPLPSRTSNPRPPRAVIEMRAYTASREPGAATPAAQHSPPRGRPGLAFQFLLLGSRLFT
jgi:hypothetical protein